MSEPSSAPDANEAFLLQFQQEHEAALDKPAVVERSCSLRPDLAKRIRARAAIAPLLNGMSPAPEDPMPERLGEFRILRAVGGGGMGHIYEARHERLGRRVAVKTIRPDRASPEARERFRREQQALARLHQTHIVSIYQAGEEGPIQYFAMPYIDGAALHHVVRAALWHETIRPRRQTPTLGKLAAEVSAATEPNAQGSTLDAPPRPPASPAADADAALTLSEPYFRSVAEALADAAEALHHAHGAGLLHRDMKPSNLMVDKGGRCWLIDFGLAGLLAGPAGAADPLGSAAPVTTTGLLGTMQYMAPEQWAGDKLDARTDVWGLGVTLYELLTLRQAFDGSADAVKRKVLGEEPVAPRRLVGNVPADLAAICRKAMRKRPDDRYPTAGAFAEDLRRWLRYQPTVARPPWPPRRAWLWAKRDKWRAAAVLLSTLIVLLGPLAVIFRLRASLVTIENSAERAREKADQEYDAQWRQLQRMQFGLPIGWSQERLEMVRDHYKDRPEDAKRKGRDDAAATLAGLDAVTEKKIEQHAGSLAFSRDGKRLVLGGVGRFSGAPPVKGGVYDRGADRLTPSEQPGDDADGPVAFAADGTPLQLVAKDAYTLRLWDVDRQRAVREVVFAEKLPPVPLDADNQPALALSEDGALVAASTKLPDGKRVLVVWEAATGKEVARAAEEAEVEVLAFSPDNSLLAAGDETGAITVRPLTQFDRGTPLPAGRLSVHSLAFTRDPVRRHKDGRDASGWLLAAGEAGGAITIWDVERKVLRTQCMGSNYDVDCLAFSPDGSLLASAGRYAPRVWDVATGRVLLTLHYGNTEPGLAFSPDGQFLAVSKLPIFFGNEGGVEVYALDYGRGIHTLRGLRGQVEKTCLSPDERYLAALTQDWQVGVWDFKTGRLLHVFEASVGPWADNAALAFSNDGRLACASWRGAVLWDVDRGQEIRRWDDLPPGLVNLLAFHPSGKLLLFREETEDMRQSPDSSAPARDHPRVCRIRDLLAKDPAATAIALPELNKHVWPGVCPADGSFFVANGLHNAGGKPAPHLIVYDGLTGKVLWDLTYDGEDEIGPRLDPTGKLLAFYQPGGKHIALVEMPTGKARGFLPWVHSVGLGGEWILDTTPADSSGQLFGLSLHRRGEERPLLTLAPYDLPSGGALFNVAGTHVAWGNADGTVTVCDIQEVRRRLAAVGFGW